MPKGSMKRPAAATESPKKKTVKIDPITAGCQQVASEIEGADHLPDTLRTMLASNLLSTLGVAKEERHEFQKAFVDMVGETLKSIEQNIMKQIADAEATVQSADVEKATREAAQSKAESAFQAKQDEIVQKKTDVSADKEALDSAFAKLEAAKAAQECGDVESDNARKEKEAMENVMLEQYMPLKDGSADTKASKLHIKTLTAFVKKNNFDLALITAVTNALGKTVDSRGDFDRLVLQQFEDAFNQRVVEATKLLENGEPDKLERQRVTQAAQGEHDAASQKLNSSVELFDAAKTEESTLSKALKDATKAVNGLLPEIEEAEELHRSLQSRLLEFREGVLITFNNMKDPPPPVEETMEPAGECSEQLADKTEVDLIQSNAAVEAGA